MIHTTVVGIRVKTMGLRLWSPGSVSNQPCGEGGCLGRYHRLRLWLRISTCSHASEGVWGERSPPLPAGGPWHQGATAATPLQVIGEQPRKNLASLGIFVASPAKYGCKNSFPLDSGREVLAATSGRGRGKGAGWEALQGAASIAQYHAVPYHAMLCCASSHQSRSWQQELGIGKAGSCMQILHAVEWRCKAGRASREETRGLSFLSRDHNGLPSASVELVLPSGWWRGEELQPLQELMEWFLNMVLATECRPRAGRLACPESALDWVLSLANTFCLEV